MKIPQLAKPSRNILPHDPPYFILPHYGLLSALPSLEPLRPFFWQGAILPSGKAILPGIPAPPG